MTFILLVLLNIIHTHISNVFYKSVSNEIIIFNREKKHFGIVQTNTPTRIVLNINWK